MASVSAAGKISPISFQPGAEYPIYGTALLGGAYNSHLVSAVAFIVLAVTGAMNRWMALWLVICTAAGLMLDRRPMSRKVVLRAVPSQLFFYGQVLLRATAHVLPYYAFAFALYLCVAPVVLPLNFAISSFALLYGFYMIVRAYWVSRYLWTLTRHYDRAGHTFATHQANLKTQQSAIRHVLWAYFLGNVGLVVRCASQVITISGFEFLRQRLSLDISEHPVWHAYGTTIFVTAVIVWFITLWWSIQPALIVYYRTHRTFHTCRPLFDSIHSIHHRGVFPTNLDSGTISPMEFLITEMLVPTTTLVPNWYWAIGQILLACLGHFPSHDTNSWMKTGQHHLLHHHYFNVNFGLIPREDDRYGTRMTTEHARDFLTE